MPLIIACDPGVNGGFAWTDSESFETAPMPPTDSDVCAFIAHLAELEAGLDRLHAAIISGGAIVPDAEPEQEGADL